MKLPKELRKEINEITKVEDLDGVNVQYLCFQLIEEIKELTKKISDLEFSIGLTK